MRSILLLGAAAALLLPSPASAQRATDTLRVAGVSQPVEIVRDRWGVSHIYAQNEPDLFFAQGFNAARDRLFQFEMWRRQATGTTAEILGPRELKRDIGARLHRFRGDLRAEMNHYHPRGEQIIGAFVRGVNAYIAATERDTTLLPLEFRVLGIRPQRWTPEVVISRHQGLVGNVEDELRIGRAVAALGPETVQELSWFHPGDPELRLDPALDGALLEPRILELYRAHRAPLRFQPSHVLPAFRADGAALRRLSESVAPSEPEMRRRGEPIGSNNWVVSGRRMANGRPLMANDPHRALSAPSLRYMVHLNAPGWNVIGGGEPVLPGVSIGHNEHGAWGLTVFEVDSEDLYVYDLNPADADQYRYRGAWERMRVERETILVKGAAPETVELRFTRHGPVLHVDRERNKAYALRAGWLDVGAAPYLASLRMDQARTWEEFRDACSYSHIPGENMVWADTAGNIGWQAVGVSPIRRHWSGLVPVPGDGRYEWDGYLPIRQLPHVLNPSQGFWVTANNNVLPPDYPHPYAVGYSWADPFRAQRIAEVLASRERHTLEDMMRLQQDELSIPARTLVPLLRGLPIAEPRVRDAADRLLGWDFVLGASSVPAGIYVAWERALQAGVRDLVVPRQATGLVERIALKRVIDRLLAPDARFGSDPARGRDSLLVAALTQAVDTLSRRLGPDAAAWRYGQERYKHVRMRHPLSSAVGPELRSRLEVGPLPRGGYSHTVNSTGGADNQTSGATFRIIAPAGDWERSVGTNAPGQSGDPASPHYADLFAPWARGEYFPLLFTRESVRGAAESVSVLSPR